MLPWLDSPLFQVADEVVHGDLWHEDEVAEPHRGVERHDDGLNALTGLSLNNPPNCHHRSSLDAEEQEQTALVAVAPELRRWQLLGHLTGRESGPLPHCCKLEPADYSREPHRRFNRRHDDPTSQLHISFIIIVFHGSQIRTLDSSLQKSVLAKFHTQITNQFPCFDQSHVGTWYPRLYYLNHPCFNCKQHHTPHVFKFLTSYKVKWPCVWPTEQSNPHSFLPTNAISL